MPRHATPYKMPCNQDCFNCPYPDCVVPGTKLVDTKVHERVSETHKILVRKAYEEAHREEAAARAKERWRALKADPVRYAAYKIKQAAYEKKYRQRGAAKRTAEKAGEEKIGEKNGGN